MIAKIPGWVWFVIWFAVALIILILLGLVVHALAPNGAALNLHAGHFIFTLGFT
jgi:hypothetical protein